MEITVLVWCFC